MIVFVLLGVSYYTKVLLPLWEDGEDGKEVFSAVLCLGRPRASAAALRGGVPLVLGCPIYSPTFAIQSSFKINSN